MLQFGVEEVKVVFGVFRRYDHYKWVMLVRVWSTKYECLLCKCGVREIRDAGSHEMTQWVADYDY